MSTAVIQQNENGDYRVLVDGRIVGSTLGCDYGGGFAPFSTRWLWRARLEARIALRSTLRFEASQRWTNVNPEAVTATDAHRCRKVLGDDLANMPDQAQAVTEEQVEAYIRDLAWSEAATPNEKLLVAGNIRGFWWWMTHQRPNNLPELRRAGTGDKR